MRRDRSIPHVKRVRSKGRDYYYFDTGALDDGGRRIMKRLPDPSDKRAFGAVYASLMGHRTRRASIKPEIPLGRLIGLYQTSPAWRDDLSEGSRRTYTTYLLRLQRAFGDPPADQIERKDILDLVDSMAATPAAANLLLAATRVLYAWGRNRGHVTADPCRDIAMFDLGEHQPWPDPILNAALSSDDPTVRLPVALLYYTAQRIGDVCALRWADLRDGYVHLTQQKTGKDMVIRVHQKLAAELAATPRRGFTVLADADGKRMTEARVRYRLKAFVRGLGCDAVPHGLRKNAVIALLSAGCSTAETSAISGQSLQMVEHYARLRSTRDLGSAAVLKWESNAS